MREAGTVARKIVEATTLAALDQRNPYLVLLESMKMEAAAEESQGLWEPPVVAERHLVDQLTQWVVHL